MVNYAGVVYSSAADFETAVELIANTVRIYPITFMEAGRQKFMIITGGAL